MNTELKEILDLRVNAASIRDAAKILDTLGKDTDAKAKKMLADFAKQNNYSKDEYGRYHIDLGGSVLQFEINSDGAAYDITKFPLNK